MNCFFCNSHPSASLGGSFRAPDHRGAPQHRGFERQTAVVDGLQRVQKLEVGVGP